jgi:hypothetical protein
VGAFDGSKTEWEITVGFCPVRLEVRDKLSEERVFVFEFRSFSRKWFVFELKILIDFKGCISLARGLWFSSLLKFLVRVAPSEYPPLL